MYCHTVCETAEGKLICLRLACWRLYWTWITPQKNMESVIERSLYYNPYISCLWKHEDKIGSAGDFLTAPPSLPCSQSAQINVISVTYRKDLKKHASFTWQIPQNLPTKQVFDQNWPLRNNVVETEVTWRNLGWQREQEPFLPPYTACAECVLISCMKKSWLKIRFCRDFKIRWMCVDCEHNVFVCGERD